MHDWGHGEMPSIEFSVLAETSHGSHLRVVGSPDSLGQWNPSHGLILHTGPGEYPRWSASARIPRWAVAEYKFVVVQPDGSSVWEEGGNRTLPPGAQGNAEAQTPVFRKAGFAPSRRSRGSENKAPAPALVPVPASPRVAAAPPVPAPAPAPARAAGELHEAASGDGGEELLFEAVCTHTAPGDVMRVVGSSSALGDWDPKRGLLLTTTATSFPRWSGSACLSRANSSLEWKLVIGRADGSVSWEPGENRRTVLQPGFDGSWLVRVHFGGVCSAPEPCTSLRPRSKSQPGTPTQGSGAPLRRHATELVNPPVNASRMMTTPTLAPAPAPPQPGPMAPEEPAEAAPKQWARSSSLSHFGTLLGTDGSASFPLPLNRVRSRNNGPAAEDQLVTLTLDGVDPERAAAATVEAVMETDGSKWKLRLDPPEAGATQARWTLSLGETGLTTGLHLLHFLMCGKRCLSRDLPVFGESNAVIFSEPLRRYILARDERQQDGSEHLPLSHCRTSERLPGSHGHGGPAFADDTDLGVPGQRQGSLLRPYSICGNLAALGDDEDEGGGMESKNHLANFSKEVFEGLYDGELRLRMDGYMLPDPVLTHRPQPLRMWSGAHLLKKKMGACEDAFFNDDHAMGVADGVGCMVQFASYGINAAAYAAELMVQAAKSFKETAASEVREPAEQRAKTALAAAERGAQAYGASTITCLTLDGNCVGAANLGDSGFLHLRKGHRGMQVIRRSEEQQHSWNCPYQLTRLPPALISRFPKLSLDSASDCDQYSFNVREGDLLLIFTDGLRDNLYEREILHIVDCALSPAFGDLVGLREQSTSPERLARSLALAAYERSLDASAKVPFVDYSKKHGYECQGGKQDDITVVAAWVMPQETPSVDAALAAIAEAPLTAPKPVPVEPAVEVATPALAPEMEPAAAPLAEPEAPQAADLPAEQSAEPVAEPAVEPVAEPAAEPVAEPVAPLPNASVGPSDEELKEIIARTETLMLIEAEDTEPCPAGATGASQALLADVEDLEPNGKAAELPAKDAEVTNSHTNGLGGSKAATEENTTADECKAPPSQPSSPIRPTASVTPTESTSPRANSVGGAKQSCDKRPLQPTYETPRRSSLDTANPGSQRRQSAFRAEFRPMSSSSKGHETSKGRGGRSSRRVTG